MSVFVKRNATDCHFVSSDSWVILSPIEQSIKKKIEASGVPLKDWGVNIYRGILTGCNEAFIIDQKRRDEILSWCRDAAERKRTEQIIRPILRGRDIKRYAYNWAEIYLLWIPWHFPLHLDESITGASEKAEEEFRQQFPAVYRHLSFYKDALSKRNQSETGIRYEWYALQRWGANYWDEFAKPKIVWADLARTGNAFIYDEAGFTMPNTTYLIASEDSSMLKYLIGLLNSKTILRYLDWISAKLDNTGWRWFKEYVETFPIPRVSKERLQPIVELVNRILRKRVSNPTADTASEEFEIDRLVYRLYGLTPEEIDVIEKPQNHC